MKFNRKNTACSNCPLRERTRIHGEGAFSSKIAFIGEGPGYEENEAGRPFTGQSGSFFNWGLGEAGIFRYQSWITNVITCQPPSNKIVSLEGQEAIQKCKKGFLEELKFISKKGIEILVPMGATAAEALSLEGKITKIRGSVYERVLYETKEGNLILREPSVKMSPSVTKIGSFVIIPTFHPSYLLRSQYKKKDGKANFKYVWIADLKKAKEIQEKGWTPPKENFNTNPTVEEFEQFLNLADTKGDSLAIDIETTGLSLDYGRIVCIGFASNSSNAICIPLLTTGGKPYWTNGDVIKVNKLLNKAFTFPMIYQNALFDVLRIQKAGYEISMKNVEHDTMILHHSISPELPHNLGFIVSVYGDTPYWKEDFLTRDVSILEMDQKEMRTYNLRDCVVLHQVVPELLKDLSEGCLEETYYGEGLPLLKPFGKMMSNGILFDLHEQTLVKGRYGRKVKKLEKELYELKNLPEEFNLDSDDDLRYLLFAIEPNKFKKIKELKDFVPHNEIEIKCPTCKKKSWVLPEEESLKTPICPKCQEACVVFTGEKRKKSKRKKGTGIHQQLLAVKKMKEQVIPFKKPERFAGISTPKGKVSVSQPGILSYIIAIQRRVTLINKFKNIKEIHIKEREELKFILKWISIYNDWNEVHKIMNDFTKYKPSRDGRLHGSLLIHGTSTGRPAMREPNLLQVPKRAKDIRKMFIAKPGHSFVSGDYSNLEVHVLAHETGEPNLKDVIDGKINLHDENTKILFGIDKDDPNWDKARDGAKVYQFARVQYGGGQRSIHAKVCLKCPNVILPFDKFKKADDAYFEKYSVLHAWQENQKEVAKKTRTVSTFLGRRRILMGEFHEIERQCLNCVDYKTEALTKEGWKNGLELKVGEEILTKNIDTGILEWQHLNGISNYPDSIAKCVQFDHPTMSAISTLDHRWLVFNKWYKKDVCKITKELSDHGDDRIHRTGQYLQKETAWSNQFIRLIGWFLTDGSLRGSTAGATAFNLYQSQRANPKNVHQIDNLLQQLNISNIRRLDERTQGVTWECKGTIGKQLRELFPERTLTYQFLTSISHEQCKLLFTTMLQGDGSIDKDGQHVRLTCGTEKKAEMFQTLTSLVGFHATYKYRDMSMYKPKSKKLNNIPKMTGCWIVNVHKRNKTQVLKKHKNDVTIKGVWCPQVDNTYFLGKREGTVYILGNTPIQGGAAGVVNRVTINLDNEVEKRDLPAYPILQIYDQIMYEVRDDAVPEFVTLMKKEMEKKMDFYGTEVSFPVDIEVGRSWGKLLEYKP